MSNYPTSVDDASTLYVPSNSFSTKPLLTTLAASCLSTDTDIQITASVGMIGAEPAYGIVSIDDEMILYSGHSEVGSVYKITGCVRGFGGTTAIGHASGVSARWRYVANFDLALQVALIAVQNTLGITGAFNFVEAPLAALVNKQTGTSYTILDGDRGKLITGTNASSQAYSIAQAGSGGSFADGWFVDIENRGAGALTITPATSTIDGAASLALTTDQGVRLFSDGTNYFTQRGVGGGSGTPGGSDTQVQYNDSGAFGGDAGLVWDVVNKMLSIINGSGAASIVIDGAASHESVAWFKKAGVNRWSLFRDSDTESGSNVGSSFRLNRFSDAGAFLDWVFKISRSTGVVDFKAGVKLNSGQTLDGVVTTVGSPGSDANVPTEQAVREAIAYSGCAVENSTGWTLTDGSPNTLTWDTEILDTGSYHSTSSNTSRMTVPATGNYRISAMVQVNTSGTISLAGAAILVSFLKNGAGGIISQVKSVPLDPSAAGTSTGFTLVVDASLASGDYIEVNVSPNTGASVVAGVAPGNFSIQRLN